MSRFPIPYTLVKKGKEGVKILEELSIEAMQKQ